MYNLAKLDKIRDLERRVGYFKDGGFCDERRRPDDEFIEG